MEITPLTPDDLWDMAGVTDHMMVLAGTLWGVVQECWCYVARKGPLSLFQLEEGSEHFHLHRVLEQGSVRSFMLERYLKQSREDICSDLHGGIVP